MAQIHNARAAQERGHAREAIDHDAVRSTYRRWAGIYDTVFGGVTSPGRNRAVDAVNRLPAGRVLEVGVGTGLALPHYRREMQVVGVDLSAPMLERARQRVADQGLGNVVGLIEMDAERMAFADASFDIAVAMYTASVVPDARKLFAEMSRVVRPGGHLLFINHFAASDGPRWWVERSLSPLARWLGWHPDFALRDLLDPEAIRIESMEHCPPAGIFSLLQLRNGADVTAQAALAAA